VAQGLADLIMAQPEGKEHVTDIFKNIIGAMFPHLKSVQEDKDAEMKKVIKKEASAGVLTFKAAQDSFIQQKAREMSLPDDFKRKLAEKRRK
jgi:hypothetical protein